MSRTSLVLLSICLFLVAIVTQVSSTSATLLAQPRSLINDLSQSFRLRLIVDAEYFDNRRFRYSIEEAFSSLQGRTKINFKRLMGSNDADDIKHNLMPAGGGTLILKHDTIFLIKSDSSKPGLRCQRITLDKMREMYFLQTFATIVPINTHGPSNILFVVEHFRDKFVRLNVLPPNVRNIPSVMFQYKSKEFQLHCLYAKEQVGAANSNSQTIDAGILPLRVMLDLPDGLHVDFDFLQHVSGELIEDTDERQQSGADVDNFDEFFIERAAGCSYASASDESDREESRLFHDSLEQVGGNPKDGNQRNSFSFLAKVPKSFRGTEESTRVTYNEALNVMRLESQSASRQTSLLIDYNLGTTHHVLEKPHEGDGDPTEDEALDQVLPEVAFMLEGDREPTRRSCILVESPKYKLSGDIAQLLVPSGRPYIELGEARVRGIRTRAYEAYNTTWPSWLEQSLQYYEYHQPEAASAHDRTTQRAREAYHNNLAAGVVLNTVVYTSVEDDRLIQVEIFRVYHESGRVLSQVTIPIYDFSWSPSQIDVASFSLLEKCKQVPELSGEKMAPTKYGRVAMLLAGDMSARDEGTVNWLRDARLRDLSLLASIQSNMKIPCSTIDDLSSRVFGLESNETRGISDARSARIDVSFRFATSARRLVAKLTYRGHGRAKKLYQFKLFRLEHSSLPSCFYFAAHRKLDTFLAYSRQDSLCLIDFGLAPVTIDEDDPKRVLQPKAFDFSADHENPSSSSFEIYLVSHEDARNPSDLMAQLHSSPLSRSSNSQLLTRLSLTNFHRDTEEKPSLSSINLLVKALKFLDVNDDQQPFKVDDVSLEDTNKFKDFALVVDDKLSYKSQDGSDLTSDLDGCRVACLRDAGCKSYSFCLRGSTSECVLSSVNFKPGTELLVQLIDIQQQESERAPFHRAGARRSSKFSLKVNETHAVRIETRNNCELHNKRYLDSFHKSERRQNLGDFSSIKPVDSRDQCAQRCLKAALKVLSDSDNLLATTKRNLEQMLARSDVADESASSDSTQAVSIYNSVRGLQRQAAKQMCKEFFYLDSLNLLNLAPKLQARYQLSSERLAQDDQAQGYCLLPGHPDEPRDSQAYDKDATIELERYALKFEDFYEKQRNVRLLPSKRTEAELNAYQKFMAKEMPTDMQEFEPLLDILNGDKNSQTHMMLSHVDEVTCATMCSIQAIGPWPSCRSFDLVVMSVGGDKPNALCLLNSITIEDALESDQKHLIEYQNSQTLVYSHYEPRLGLTTTKKKTSLDEKLQGTSQSEQDIKSQSRRKMYFGMPLMMIICISLVGSLTGILMGLNLGTKYSSLNRRLLRSSSLTNSIVDMQQEPFSLTIDVGSMDLRHMSR